MAHLTLADQKCFSEARVRGRRCTYVSFTKETSPFGSHIITSIPVGWRISGEDIINPPHELQHRILDGGALHVKRHPHHPSDAFDVTSFHTEVTSPSSHTSVCSAKTRSKVPPPCTMAGDLMSSNLLRELHQLTSSPWQRRTARARRHAHHLSEVLDVDAKIQQNSSVIGEHSSPGHTWNELADLLEHARREEVAGTRSTPHGVRRTR